jgi:hypothetical protein
MKISSKCSVTPSGAYSKCSGERRQPEGRTRAVARRRSRSGRNAPRESGYAASRKHAATPNAANRSELTAGENIPRCSLLHLRRHLHRRLLLLTDTMSRGDTTDATGR